MVTAAEVPRLLSDMTVAVIHRFNAPIDDVWDLLSDVERMGGVGPEHIAASWVDDKRGVGAQFNGTNSRDDMEWTVPCFVTEWEPPQRFAWTVLDPDNPSSTWSYTLRAVDGGTEVIQRFSHGPNYSFVRLWAEQNPEDAEFIIRRRVATLHADMKTTLENAERLLVPAQ